MEQTNQQEFPLEAYSDRILMKRVSLSAKTASGIILGEIDSSSEAGYGVAVSVGEGKISDDGVFKSMKTRVGDLITFRHNQPIRINYKGEDYWMIRESDVYFRVNDKDVDMQPYQTEGKEYKQPSSMLQ